VNAPAPTGGPNLTSYIGNAANIFNPSRFGRQSHCYVRIYGQSAMKQYFRYFQTQTFASTSRLICYYYFISFGYSCSKYEFVLSYLCIRLSKNRLNVCVFCWYISNFVINSRIAAAALPTPRLTTPKRTRLTIR
jgi:hypothetical protein